MLPCSLARLKQDAFLDYCIKDKNEMQNRPPHTISKSVAAGHPFHEKPMILKAEESISPSIAGKLEFAGK